MRKPVTSDTTAPVEGFDEGDVDATPGLTEQSVTPRLLSGRYLLEELVASGGMASVWRAHDEVLARTVAVKLLHDHLAADGDFRERFRREAIAAAKLTHPNVVSLYDTGSDAGDVYLVMEFIDGPTLKDVIRTQGELEVPQAAAIGAAVARALDYAHSRGLVHRDVKPANILIGTDGSVKVADFGIAKADQSDDLTQTGTVLGTAAYVAPEQIRGDTVDGKADQYGLAVVLYETLTGRQPFKGSTPVATAAQRLERDALPVRSLRANTPRALDALLMRAMARDPRDRFPSCGAFADALAEYAGGDTSDTATAALAEAGGAASDDAGQATSLGSGWAGRPISRRRRRAGADGGEPAQIEPSGATAVGKGETFLRSEGRFLAPVLALVLLATALIGVGLGTGVLETDPGSAFPRIASQEGPGAEPGTSDLVEIAGPPVVFDPGGSGSERNQDLPRLLDGDPETFWRTERYRSRAFGNLKEGVGFYVDLGEPHAIDAVALRTVTPGLTIELRVADQPADELAGWELVSRVETDDELITLNPAEPVTARYALVWITGELPLFEGQFAAGFSQVAVEGRPT